MYIYQSPLFYAHILFLFFFLRALSDFVKEAQQRNDGSLILVIVLFTAGSLGLFSGLLIDYGIRIVPGPILFKWVLQLGLGLLMAFGWHQGMALLKH